MNEQERVVLSVGGMSCVRCSAAVEYALSRLDGVLEAVVSFADGKAVVLIESGKVNRKALEKAVRDAGYTIVEDKETFRRKEMRRQWGMFLFATVLSLPFAVMMVLMFVAPHAPLTHFLHNGWLQFALATPVQLVAGFRFYKTAIASLKNRAPGMDLLVAMGTTAAWGYSTYTVLTGGEHIYFEGAAMVITLVLLGRLLETRAREKTSAAIEKLLCLRPATATVWREGGWMTVAAETIQVGDRLLVKAGEHIPADGVVTAGESFADESMLTGESMPVKKQVGDTVTGGTMNGNGVLEMTAQAVGEQTVLSGIIRLVESAQNSKAPVQRLADMIAAWFVPCVLAIAMVTLIGHLLVGNDVSAAIEHAVAVLVIACPCSLGLATPTALMVGMGKGATLGILIKDAKALEDACRLKTVLLDKTGTVTKGVPAVTDIWTPKTVDAQTVLRVAASIEAYSEHPLANAVVSSYAGEHTEVTDFKAEIGCGVSGVTDGITVKIGKADFAAVVGFEIAADWVSERQNEGKTVLYVSFDGETTDLLAVADPIHTHSRAAIAELHALDIQTVMLTGDKRETALSIARSAGIDEVIAEVLPDQKAAAVRRMREMRGAVGMAGDGINDAPALAEATVGFAMGNGSDIAMESGDVVLVGGGIAALPRAVKLSRATMRKIKQNLFWAFFYNCIGIPLAAFGWLSPVIAGAAMAMSSVSVVTNSLLLYKCKI